MFENDLYECIESFGFHSFLKEKLNTEFNKH